MYLAVSNELTGDNVKIYKQILQIKHKLLRKLLRKPGKET